MRARGDCVDLYPMKRKTIYLMLLGLGWLVGTRGLAMEPLRVGDCWTYATRPGEEASYVVIRRITPLPKGQAVVGVSVIGVRVKAPPGELTDLPYVPVQAHTLQADLRDRVERNPPALAWESAHARWWERYGSRGQAGATADRIAKVIAFVEQSLGEAR